MIRRNLATLTIWSDTRSVAEISTRLGLRATDSADIGDPTRAGIVGQDLPSGHLRYEQTRWSLDADENQVDPEDETGFSAVRVLMDTVRESIPAIAELAASGDEVLLRWSGYSDSWQGGFVLPPDLMRDLAAAGVELMGTAYLEADEADEADDADEDPDEADEDGDDDEDDVSDRAVRAAVPLLVDDLRASLMNLMRDQFRLTAAAAELAASIPDLDRAFAVARRTVVEPDVSDADRAALRRAANGLLAVIPNATNPARLYLTRMLLITEIVLEGDDR